MASNEYKKKGTCFYTDLIELHHLYDQILPPLFEKIKILEEVFRGLWSLIKNSLFLKQ